MTIFSFHTIIAFRMSPLQQKEKNLMHILSQFGQGFYGMSDIDMLSNIFANESAGLKFCSKSVISDHK